MAFKFELLALWIFVCLVWLYVSGTPERTFHRLNWLAQYRVNVAWELKAWMLDSLQYKFRAEKSYDMRLFVLRQDGFQILKSNGKASIPAGHRKTRRKNSLNSLRCPNAIKYQVNKFNNLTTLVIAARLKIFKTRQWKWERIKCEKSRSPLNCSPWINLNHT